MIVSDLLQTQTLSQGDDGYHAERVFIVDNITGAKEARLYNALQTSGIPIHGEPHPVIPNIFVSNVRAEPLKSGDQIKISVDYDPLDEEAGQTEESGGSGAISVSSGTTSEQTYRDINGEYLLVKYTGASGVGQYFTEQSIERVDVQRPQITVTLKRTEDILPKQAMQNYVGKVNSLPWSGFPAKTWLCTGIFINQDKNKFEVDYRFAYDVKTWQAEVTINVDNVVPVDYSIGNGAEIYDVYESANFNELGLSF